MERDQMVHLVIVAQNGDTEALNALFNAFYNDVYYFALKTVKDPEIACDITQETFVTIITSLKDLKEPTAFVTWMKQIAYSQCTRYFRKRKDVLLDEDEEGNTVLDTVTEDRTEFIPDQAVDQADFRKTILDMIDTLAPEQRAALLLYYFDECSVKQIAQIQGVSEGTVKSRLNYARKAIKSSVEDYEKKNNVKLHSVGILPLLLWLLHSGKDALMPAAYADAAAVGITTSTGVTITVGASSTTTTAVAAVATGTGIGAKLAAIPLAVKITAGVAGLLLIAGGAAAVLLIDPPTDPTGMIPTQSTILEKPVVDPTQTQPATTIPSITEPMVTEPTGEEPTEEATGEDPMWTEPPAVDPPEDDPSVEDPSEDDLPVVVPPTEEEKPDEREVVPEGCTYVMADGTILKTGDEMPETISDGDELITSDYIYKYGYFYGASSFVDQDIEGWGMRCTAEKAECEPLMAYINGAPLLSMHNAFIDNQFLQVAPTIPDTVTDIQQAFFGCTALTQAPQLSATLTSTYGAFYGCKALQVSPTIPAGVKDMSFTFYGCRSLTAAPVLPASVTNLYHTFDGCKALVTAPDVPDSVVDMEGTFYNCESLKNAPKIGRNVKNMNWAFYGCSSLTTVQSLPTAATSMKYTFAECLALTSVPDIPERVTDLYGAFDGCVALVSAPGLGSSVVDMTCTFQDCVRLTAAPAIPSTVRDMSFAFANCTALTTAPVIPAGVSDMDSAFLNCTNLTGRVRIDATLGDYAVCDDGDAYCYKCTNMGYDCPTCPDCSYFADCFTGTTKAIVLVGSSDKLEEIAATADNGNVTVE